MPDWYCNFATGNDTTGDGSSGNPYKTIQKALTTAGTAAVTNVVYVMDDEPLSSPLVFPASNRNTIITGSQASGYPAISNASGAIASFANYACFEHVELVISAANETLGFQGNYSDVIFNVSGGWSVTGTTSALYRCYLFGGFGGIVGLNCLNLIQSIVDCDGLIGNSAVSAAIISECLIIQRSVFRGGVNRNGAIITNSTIVAPNGSSSFGVTIGDIRGGLITSNIFSGFATGITASTSTIATDNSFFDCATEISTAPLQARNETLVSDPFVNQSIGDFTPIDLGDIPQSWPGWFAALPMTNGRYRGAIQPAGSGGSAGFTGIRGTSKRLGT